MNQPEIDKMIAAAEGEKGVHEERGQNVGSCIKYQKVTGNGPGDSWCMSFVVWAVTQALGYSVIKKTGSCEIEREWAHHLGILVLGPKRGRIGLLINREQDHAHHAFIVTSDPDASGRFATVEGNSNDDGSTNGNGVYDHHRGGPDDPLHYEFIDLTHL